MGFSSSIDWATSTWNCFWICVSFAWTEKNISKYWEKTAIESITKQNWYLTTIDQRRDDSFDDCRLLLLNNGHWLSKSRVRIFIAEQTALSSRTSRYFQMRPILLRIVRGSAKTKQKFRSSSDPKLDRQTFQITSLQRRYVSFVIYSPKWAYVEQLCHSFYFL